MISFGATNDKRVLDALHNAIFGTPIEGDVGFVLDVDGKPAGIAKLKVTPEESHIVRVGVMPKLRGKGYGDFFTRSLMNVLIDVTDKIVIDYVSDYYLKFGFAEENGTMVIDPEKLVLPHACGCGNADKK